MRRGVLIVSALLALGAILYLGSQPTATVQPSVVNQPESAPVAVPVAGEVFGPGQADTDSNTSASGPGEWLMEGSNPARNRQTSATVALPLKQSGVIGIPGADENASPPVIARGMLLTETSKQLRAFDLASGQQRWTYNEPGSYVSPAIAGDRVFFRAESDNKGEIIALDLQSGSKLWGFTPKRISSEANGYYGGHLTAPVIVDGVVFVGAGKEVYALDAATGLVKWEFDTQDYITSSPAVDGGQVYITDFQFAYAIDQIEGTLRWASPVETGFSFSIIATSNTVLVTSGAKLLALATADGKQQWVLDAPGQNLIPAAADEQRAYVKSTATLIALDLVSGQELWRVKDNNFISLPVLSRGQIFFIQGMQASTQLIALDATTGTNIWQQPVEKLATTAPVIAGRAMYIRTLDGRILAFSS
jgi:outer membrane protein assembly factor BamB